MLCVLMMLPNYAIIYLLTILGFPDMDREAVGLSAVLIAWICPNVDEIRSRR